MCGVCGWVSTYPGDPAPEMSAMLDALKDRGPDGRGYWRSPDSRCLLGHTRLAILDVEGSRQPMTNEDGSVTLTYNGEIYNFTDLRRWLVRRNHVFRSRGDTEVLVHLYEELGPSMVDVLDGMFAFGIFDRRTGSLLLARDRIGIKPLSYWQSPRGSLLFASDTRTLLASRIVPRRIAREALDQYLRLGYVVHPVSWIAGARQLEPGETLVWTNGATRRQRYFTWEYEPDQALADASDARQTLIDALESSTREQLVSDVPLGSFLSGGIDSSVVSALAQRSLTRTGTELRSFTVRFAPGEFDESVRARAIAGDIGTSHAEIPADDLGMTRSTMDRIVDALGEPFGDSSALAVYLLCQQVRRDVTVALSGDGGDELFYGYAGLRKQRAARRLKVMPAAWRRLASRGTAGSARPLQRRLHRAIELSLRDDASLIVEWARRWQPHDLAAVNPAAAARLDQGDQVGEEMRDRIGRGDRGGFMEQQLRFHMLIDLPGDCLFKVDRMSMAHGLEVRVPMLSNRMLAFGSRLPLAGRARGPRTKEPLRTVAEMLAPTNSTPAPKHGFGFPLDRWLRDPLPGLWREWRLSTVLEAAGFDRRGLDDLVAAYARCDDGTEWTARTRAVQLWDLALLGVWMDRQGLSLS